MHHPNRYFVKNITKYNSKRNLLAKVISSICYKLSFILLSSSLRLTDSVKIQRSREENLAYGLFLKG